MILRCIPNARLVPFCAALLAGLAWAALTAGTAAAQEPERPERFAGAYKIDDWESLEAKGIRHVFYLQPDGRFLLGAEWPNHESTRFLGTWSFSGEAIVLQGQGEVWTNQGSWWVPFQRTFTVDKKDGLIRLTPVPEKNRFGMAGWPNAFLLLFPEEDKRSRLR